MKLSPNGFEFIKSFEGYHTRLPDGRCKAYWDATGKVWTIGWGCTEGVSQGDIWTREQAEKGFYRELTKHMRFVDQLCKEFNFKPNQNQYDALVSHCYNCGPGGTRKVFKSNFNFSVYGLTSGGVRLRGLRIRRQAEQKLFETPTKKEVIAQSRQLQTGTRVEQFVKWSGISSFFSLAYLGEIEKFLQDPKTIALLVVGFSFWATLKYINWRTLQAHAEGRYIPSKRKKK